jgi:hypothetical protein
MWIRVADPQATLLPSPELEALLLLEVDEESLDEELVELLPLLLGSLLVDAASLAGVDDEDLDFEPERLSVL